MNDEHDPIREAAQRAVKRLTTPLDELIAKPDPMPTPDASWTYRSLAGPVDKSAALDAILNAEEKNHGMIRPPWERPGRERTTAVSIKAVKADGRWMVDPTEVVAAWERIDTEWHEDHPAEVQTRCIFSDELGVLTIQARWWRLGQ